MLQTNFAIKNEIWLLETYAKSVWLWKRCEVSLSQLFPTLVSTLSQKQYERWDIVKTYRIFKRHTRDTPSRH